MSQPDRETAAGAVESRGDARPHADDTANAPADPAATVNIGASGEPAQSGRDSGRASDMTRVAEN